MTHMRYRGTGTSLRIEAMTSLTGSAGEDFAPVVEDADMGSQRIEDGQRAVDPRLQRAQRGVAVAQRLVAGDVLGVGDDEADFLLQDRLAVRLGVAAIEFRLRGGKDQLAHDPAHVHFRRVFPGPGGELHVVRPPRDHQQPGLDGHRPLRDPQRADRRHRREHLECAAFAVQRL